MTRSNRRLAVLLGSMLIIAGIAACSSSRVFESSDSAPSRPRDVSNVQNAVPKNEPRSRYGNPDSYVVYGKRYYTLDSSRGYREQGDASWYGTKFHGRRTSSGEPYDMYKMTAAHKTLPLPSYVEVTNLDNGRKVILKVNDRGPFHGGRIIDLSYAAASKLNMLGKGTARVQVVAIDPRAPTAAVMTPVQMAPVQAASAHAAPAFTPPAEATETQLFLQVGAFQSRDNAERMRRNIEQQRVGDVRIVESVLEQGTFYKVQVGPLADNTEADRVARSLKPQGINATRAYAP